MMKSKWVIPALIGWLMGATIYAIRYKEYIHLVDTVVPLLLVAYFYYTNFHLDYRGES